MQSFTRFGFCHFHSHINITLKIIFSIVLCEILFYSTPIVFYVLLQLFSISGCFLKLQCFWPLRVTVQIIVRKHITWLLDFETVEKGNQTGSVIIYQTLFLCADTKLNIYILFPEVFFFLESLIWLPNQCLQRFNYNYTVHIYMEFIAKLNCLAAYGCL